MKLQFLFAVAAMTLAVGCSSDPDPGLGPDAGPGPDTDSGPGPDAGPDTDAGPDADTGPDTDGDRLPDSVETNTGVYVSPNDTGTDPAKADTDGDNIKDGDEVLGTTTGVNLPALGFSATHKDLAVEFDWYDDDTECGSAHSHRPTPGMISRMTAAYAAAPLMNPDGKTGIHFIPDYGQGGAFTGGSLITGQADGNLDFDLEGPAGGFGVGTPFHTSKLANFDFNRKGIFYYALMLHRFITPGALGVGQLDGDDFVLAADCSNAKDQLLANATFHELGHDFTLRHGGFEWENFKPNYISSMNYKWGEGLDLDCDGLSDGDGSIGFSSGTKADLDENALIEANGVCGPGNPIDWNGNGMIDPDPIAFDLNPQDSPGLTVLKDSNDWGQVTFEGLNDAD